LIIQVLITGECYSSDRNIFPYLGCVQFGSVFYPSAHSVGRQASFQGLNSPGKKVNKALHLVESFT